MTILERLANRDLIAPFAVSDLPGRARVVVVGGGIIGSSVAYHLAQLGWTDVVVLERGRLTCGTTWHAAGLVAQVRATHALTELSRYGAGLYERLSRETGVETGLRRVGALTVARTEGRMQENLYGVTMAAAFGIDAEILTPAEVKDRWPPATTDDVVGATFFPADATVNPGDAALALATGAHAKGVRFAEGVSVTGFRVREGAVTGVGTDRGDVECEIVVIAAGLWSAEVGRLAGVSIPLYAAEHMWVMTDEAQGAEERLPVLRDLDASFYVRHYRGRYLVGAFEPKGKPRSVTSIEGMFTELGPDWDHFAPVLANARERLPELETIGFEHFLLAPESFTPDNNFHLGEAPEVRNVFVAAGFNSQGVIFGPGAGRALAEWIVEGHPTMDLAEVDVARASRWQNNRSYLHARTYESLGRLYAMHWPYRQPATARGVRRTPLYDRLDQAGAVFGEAAGWERANWFAALGHDREYRYAFGPQNWFDVVGQESDAAREAVALFDLSTYTKVMVEGPDAEAAMQRVCASDVGFAPGRIVYTTWCNDRGGIEMDPTVTRLEQDRYLVVAPTLAQTRTNAWLARFLQGDVRARATDVTSGYAVLAVMGPRSRELLSRLTQEDLSNDAFAFGAAKEIDAGWAKAWALRVSYAGELGWELFVPTEFAVNLHDQIAAAGADLGLRHAGFHALDSLRLERGFRSYGHDIGPMDDPFAAGLGFTVALDKQMGFAGHHVLARLREAPRTHRLVSIRVENAEDMLFGGEPIVRAGRFVGRVTSGAFGYTLGAPVGLAWIRADEPVTQAWLDAEALEVEIRAERIPVSAGLRAFFDPEGRRART